MNHTPGKLSLDDLRERSNAGTIHTVIVAFPDIYGRLVGKRCDAEYFLESIAGQGTHACNYLLTVDMEMNPVQGYQFANWQRGYGDFHLVPDLHTLRQITWQSQTALILCDVHDSASHTPVAIAPRSLLREQIRRAAERGLEVFGASELEYYIFNTPYRDVALGTPARPAGWYIEDYHLLQGTRVEQLNGAARRHLKSSGIPPECTKGEWGLGQHELNLRYCEALEMADRHVLMKQCLKEIAEEHQMSVTFMAKFHAERAGSSCHVHLSLWSDGANRFAGTTDSYGPGIHGSRMLGQVAAGWLTYLPELMVLLAPNVNSYKRYQAGSWAPTRLAWSYDNRTAAVRVVGHGESLRLECRLPGADCNPYLTYAALLAAGLAGIEHDLKPAPLFAGDVYTSHEIPIVSRTLSEAIGRFASSEFARRAFGDSVVEHYLHYFSTEDQAYGRAVTDWERERYFERI